MTREDVSPEGRKFRDEHRTFVGGVPAIMARISFSGELGCGIHVAPQFQTALADAIEEAGHDLGPRWYGARVLMSLRLEKAWGAWALDYRPDFTATESGLDVFINWDKDFIGKEAALAERETGPSKKLVTLEIDSPDIDVVNDEALSSDGEAVGYVSPGGYAHFTGKSMAMGYVPTDMATGGTRLKVEIIGEMFDATVLGAPVCDANGERMRGKPNPPCDENHDWRGLPCGLSSFHELSRQDFD